MIVVYSLGSHFRYQKYVKKGYMEMRKWIYLVPFWSVPGRSILHYSINIMKCSCLTFGAVHVVFDEMCCK